MSRADAAVIETSGRVGWDDESRDGANRRLEERDGSGSEAAEGGRRAPLGVRRDPRMPMRRPMGRPHALHEKFTRARQGSEENQGIRLGPPLALDEVEPIAPVSRVETPSRQRGPRPRTPYVTKKRVDHEKKTLAALVLLSLMLPAVALAAVHATGTWEGLALYVGGDSTYDHETRIVIPCLGAPGTAKYTYPNLGGTVCESELTLASISGNIRIYNDNTLTPGCLDGKVRLSFSSQLTSVVHFQWMRLDGTVENEGLLSKTGSLLCPLDP
ncbi:hypothetical protein [Nannocystis pusilla]|uniref:hypothetical protein n=1 Tax=Nannocystis pusilla TaxID=889268 RepID=UPI003B7DA0FC